MQIPFEDWLLKPQKCKRVQMSTMYEPVSDAVASLVVDLSPTLDDGLVLETSCFGWAKLESD